MQIKRTVYFLYFTKLGFRVEAGKGGSSALLIFNKAKKMKIGSGRQGVFGGTMREVSRILKSHVLGMSAWREAKTAKISECKEKRVEIFQRSF